MKAGAGPVAALGLTISTLLVGTGGFPNSKQPRMTLAFLGLKARKISISGMI